MKKLLLSLVLVASVLLVSCEKEKDKEEEEKFSLSGKTYAAYGYKSYTSDDDVYWVMRFTSDTQVERTARKVSPTGGIIGDAESWTYALSYPSVVFYDEDGEKYNTGTFVDENTYRTTGYQGAITEYILQK